MTRLVDPHVRYQRSYLDASDEFAASGDTRDGDGPCGHIGYSVRPSARRQGHATAALRRSLKVARERLGLERVLVTCAEDNPASRTVIEACGGTYEDSREHTRRYWITTS